MKNDRIIERLDDSEENKIDSMYKYLMNTNDQNITEADINYIQNLINDTYQIHKYGEKMRKSSYKIQGVLLGVWGVMTIATKGYTLSQFPMYAYWMGVNSYFSRRPVIRRYEESLKKYGLNFQEYQKLIKSNKLQELATLADIYDSQYQRGEKFTLNNEPFPEFAYSDINNYRNKAFFLEFVLGDDGRITANAGFIDLDKKKDKEDNDNEPNA